MTVIELIDKNAERFSEKTALCDMEREPSIPLLFPIRTMN